MEAPEHIFEPTDGQECRENYISLYELYQSGKEKYDTAIGALQALQLDIIKAMNDARPRFNMVDNEEFLCWVAQYGDNTG